MSIYNSSPIPLRRKPSENEAEGLLVGDFKCGE